MARKGPDVVLLHSGLHRIKPKGCSTPPRPQLWARLNLSSGIFAAAKTTVHCCCTDRRVLDHGTLLSMGDSPADEDKKATTRDVEGRPTGSETGCVLGVSREARKVEPVKIYAPTRELCLHWSSGREVPDALRHGQLARSWERCGSTTQPRSWSCWSGGDSGHSRLPESIGHWCADRTSAACMVSATILRRPPPPSRGHPRLTRTLPCQASRRTCWWLSTAKAAATHNPDVKGD